MKKILVWLAAPRPQFFTAAVVPVALGAAVAWNGTGLIDWGLFWITMSGAVLAQAGLNLTNDYYDFKSGTDVVNKTPTPFSGGSGVIIKGLLKPAEVLAAGLLCFSATAAIGFYLVFLIKGYMLIAIGAIGIFLAFFYTASPLKMGYTRLGELATGIGFGPLMVLGSYYVQARRLAWEPFWASVPVAILIALVLYINEFPDYEADRVSGKNNTVVSIGKKKAAGYYALFMVSAYLAVAAGVAAGIFPGLSLITAATFPLAAIAIKTARTHYGKIKELLPANALTVAVHFLFGLLFTLSYVWGRT
ncbi:MAG: 1,4-dihydroxy-2-naphthoate octaprenyltransferase [Dehalococcoidales bacterium]|jgi:1,4-dihydroxy-2-naphthoate octaprenyltransferase